MDTEVPTIHEEFNTSVKHRTAVRGVDRSFSKGNGSKRAQKGTSSLKGEALNNCNNRGEQSSRFKRNKKGTICGSPKTTAV